MSLQFVCIEVRRNLRCANVFLRFDQRLTAVDFLKINVEEDSLRLHEDSVELRIALDGLFTAEARTMANLIVEENNASFRLTVDNIVDYWIDDERAKNESKLLDIRPRVTIDSDTALLCSNCECNLSGVKQYHRVLELPSSGVEAGDLFCHHQSDFGETLMPKADDLFYGFHFIVLKLVDNDHLLAHLKEKEGHLYCRRCLQLLGQTLFAGKAAKLWTDTLRLRADQANAEAHIQHLIDAPTDCHSYQLLLKIMHESFACQNMTEPLLQRMQFAKLIVETSASNRKKQFLLLHLLEKDLPVLRNTVPLDAGTAAAADPHSPQLVRLQSTKGIKLLYRHVHDGDSKVTSLLTTWQRMSTNTTQISHTLFTTLLQELETNALLLPALYRYTGTDDFVLTYIFY